MAILGTFSSFTAARLGIYASQAQLQVTGNNIANINTTGYTRQRADLFSLNATGLAKYASGYGVNIGYGVLVNSVTQLRDPFLDIRFRNQNSKTAEAEATLAGLQKIAQTLDEVNKGGVDGVGVIENCLQQFKTMLERLSDDVGSEEYDSLVREAAKSLTTFFNTAAEKLQDDWDLQVDELYDTVAAVNKCLTNIRDLNEQIRKQGIYGDNALELRDHRNLYIDELSSYLGIDVEYSMERVDQYTEVEKLTIYLKDATYVDENGKTQRVKLIDGLFGGQISFTKVPELNPDYDPAYDPKSDKFDPTLYPDGFDPDDPNTIAPKGRKYLDVKGNPVVDEKDANMVDNDKFLLQVEPLVDKNDRVLVDENYLTSKVVPLNDTDLQGAIQAMRELLLEEGEFASKYDIGDFGGNVPKDPANPTWEEEILLRAQDSKASIKKGIPYYQKRLDLLAQEFARVFNENNQLPASDAYKTAFDDDNGAITGVAGAQYFVDAAGDPIKVPGTGEIITVDMVTKLEKDADGKDVRVPYVLGDTQFGDMAKYLEILRDQGELTPEYNYYDGGVLFSNSGNNNDPTGITARNISISKDWSARIVRVLNSIEPNQMDKDGNPIPRSSANDNILHLIALFDQQMKYRASDLEPDAAGGDKPFFHGSFQEMYTDLGATLGMEQNTLEGVAYNYEVMTLDLDNDRISVYGVDLNDEATSMMQFQKSYQAACRLLTTLDSMLDTLINGTLR